MRNLVILVALFLLTGQVAAADRAGGKNILRLGRPFHPALFLSPQAAEGAQTGPQWKTREEYDAYQVFAQEQDLNKKIALIDAFLEKFKDTDFKEPILLLKMQAYQGLNDGAGAAKTAREVLAINPNQVDALYLLSFTFPYTFQPGDADAESALSRALSDARTGLSALEQMAKPPNMSDSQFAEYVKPRRLVFNNTVGFAALQQKDYPTAITYLKVVSGETPNDAVVFYRLGLAYLYSDPPDHDNTVWYLARAVSLAGAGNNSLNEDEIRRFLTRAYVSPLQVRRWFVGHHHTGGGFSYSSGRFRRSHSAGNLANRYPERKGLSDAGSPRFEGRRDSAKELGSGERNSTSHGRKSRQPGEGRWSGKIQRPS